ncbi:amidase, partial [Pseudomonas syringae pv. tagetis]
AVVWIHALGRHLATFMMDFVVFLSRVRTREPARIGELVVPDMSLSLVDMIERSHRYSPFAALFNASWQPAMSVPLSW